MQQVPSIDRELLDASIERLQKLGGLGPAVEEERLVALRSLLQDQLNERQIQLAVAELLAAYNLMSPRTIEKLSERVGLFFGPAAQGVEREVLGWVLMGAQDALLDKPGADDSLEAQILQSYGLGNADAQGDELPQAEGRFGHDITNPIPVNGIDQLNNYLDKLRIHTGESITYERVGSYQEKAFPHLIDRYEIANSGGEHCATLYFYAYHGITSRKVPDGFRFKGN